MSCASASTRRFEKVAKQVSPLAVLEVELCEERNPANPDNQVAEATLYLKGVTLRAERRSRDLKHSINLISDELGRQVKRHRDKRRGRRDARAGADVPPTVAKPRRAPGEAAAAVLASRSEHPGAAGPRDRGALSLTHVASSIAPFAWAKASSSSSTPSASTASTRGSRSSSSSTTTSCARRPTRCASARASGEALDDLLPETFAVVRETSRRARWACAISTSR